MPNPQVFLSLRWDSLRKEKESYVMALQSHIDQLKHMIEIKKDEMNGNPPDPIFSRAFWYFIRDPLRIWDARKSSVVSFAIMVETESDALVMALRVVSCSIST